MSSRQSRKTSVFPGEGAYSPASGLNSASLMPRGFNGSALPAPAPQGVGQQRGMLPLMLGLNMLQNNQARPYNQGPPSIGAGLAGGMQQYLQYQQQQQDQAAQQAQYDQQLGFKQRAESRAIQSHAASMKPKVRDPGQGYAWKDPSDPSEGVYPIPGYGDEKESWEYTDNGVVYDMYGPRGDTDSKYVVGTTAQFKGGAKTAAQETLDSFNQAKRALVNARLTGDPEAIAAAESDLKYWKVQAFGAPPEKRQPGASYMLVTPEGDEYFGRDGGEGGLEYYDPKDLSWKPLNFPARKVSISGSGAEVNSGLTLSNENTYDKEFSDAFAQARVMMTQTNAALKLIEGDPAAMNVAGAVVRMIDSFTSNVKSIVDLVAEKDPALDFQSLKDDLTMFDTFDRVAIKNAAYRSSMLDLGYSYAATLGGSGVGQRVTEADLRNAMIIIGGQAGSPQQLVGVISFIQERALVRLESEAAAQNRYLRNEDNQIVFDRSMLPEVYVVNWSEPDTESGMDMTNATPDQVKLFQELKGMGILK